MRLLSPFVPLFRELLEMRYLWTTPTHMRQHAAQGEFLAPSPARRWTLAVRETLIGVGCLLKDAPMKVGSGPLAVSAL